MALRTCLLLLLSLAPLTLPAHAQTSAQKSATPAVRWVFDIKRDQYENPSGDVYLQVGKKRHRIMGTACAWSTLTRADYKDRRIPANALAACSGWWAGAGDDLYVVRNGSRLDVYRRELDEQTDIPPYKRIKSIALN